MLHRFRGMGPRVFISYSFADSEVANALAAHLRLEGFQVTIEDDTSLIGSKLATALSSRIEQSECVIQLRTATSNQSEWVAHEMELAIKRAEADGDFRLLFVVTDKANLPKPVWDWPFIDASATGLSTAVLSGIVLGACPVVRGIDIASALPTTLEEGHLNSALERLGDNRRVVLDAQGHWMRIADRCVEDWSHSEKQRVAWQAELGGNLRWLFEQADIAAACLMRQLNLHVSSALVSRKQANAACQAFFRRIMVGYLQHLAHPAHVLKIGMGTAVERDLRELLQGDGLNDGQKLAEWALYPVRRVSAYPSDQLIEIELGSVSSEKRAARVRLPSRALGKRWYSLSPGQPASPPDVITDLAEWVLFGLPDIGARAVGAYGSSVDHKDATFEKIERETGWTLEDYDLVGIP